MKTANRGHEPLEVLVIGAGFAGICCGIKLLQAGTTAFRIVEKSRGIGGTWWDNTYPGITCDVPSHFYCYSFEPNPDWSHVYSPGAEIQAYVERCADKYGVRPYIDQDCKIEALTLDQADGVWTATTADGRSFCARHVINAGGGLHQPVWPEIPGRETFAGPSMHTARWDHSVDWTGKRMAVIGSAASAIQVIPAVAQSASRVTVFQRTPNYIAPRNDRAYSDRTRARFTRWPWLNKLYRMLIFLRFDLLLYRITRPGSFYARYVTRRLKQHIRNAVHDKDLAEKMVPTYQLGCKRILVSDDLFDAVNRDNVEVVTEAIARIDRSGVITGSGRHIDADILVFATGYDVEAHMKSIHVEGVDGCLLADAWKNGAEAYDGCLIAGFPNYYMVTGPNTGVGTTSVVFMIEQSVNYILRLIERAGDRGLIEVRAEVQASYNRRLQQELAGTVWASGCRSWYRREDGRIPVLYPGNARDFRRQLKHIDFSNYQFSGIAKEAEK